MERPHSNGAVPYIGGGVRMLDKYSRVARMYPAILCSLPFFILNYFLLADYAGGVLSSFMAIKWAGGITMSLACAYLVSQMGRFIGKECYEKNIFGDELHMPTTNLLMHSDPTFSPEFKSKIHSKITEDFDLQVCTIAEEEKNETQTRKRIVECVGLIRSKVKDGRLVLQHNTEYGFVRNLVGGSTIAALISVVNVVIFVYFHPDSVALTLSIVLAVIYLFIASLGKYLIRRYGYRYSKVLIQEYVHL